MVMPILCEFWQNYWFVRNKSYIEVIRAISDSESLNRMRLKYINQIEDELTN